MSVVCLLHDTYSKPSWNMSCFILLWHMLSVVMTHNNSFDGYNNAVIQLTFDQCSEGRRNRHHISQSHSLWDDRFGSISFTFIQWISKVFLWIWVLVKVLYTRFIYKIICLKLHIGYWSKVLVFTWVKCFLLYCFDQKVYA